MIIKEETPEGVTLELEPEEARQLVAGLESHPVDLGEAAAELEQRLRAAGVAPGATAEEAALPPTWEETPDHVAESPGPPHP